jgi:hypothetical protein
MALRRTIIAVTDVVPYKHRVYTPEYGFADVLAVSRRKDRIAIRVPGLTHIHRINTVIEVELVPDPPDKGTAVLAS